MSTQPARGMRDFLPGDLRRREYVVGVVRDVYERYGFEPLETPAVENIDTLLGKYGEEGNKLIFKILKRGEHESSGQADLALRYDLTVPLARVVAQYQSELPKFFKRYQIQPVWRADRPARGRFREFYQCDVDVVGSGSLMVEAELCAAAADVLIRLGFQDFVIRLNHRQLWTGLLGGIPREKHTDVLVAFDKMDKIGPSGVSDELVARGIPFSEVSPLLGFFEAAASDKLVVHNSTSEPRGEFNQELLERLRQQIGKGDGDRPLDQLAEILQLCEESPARNKIKIDPSLARGLSYYTGAIMEINVSDMPGSLGGGGRYDNLIGMFLGRDIPACGFSLGLERILVVMSERTMFPESVGRGSSDVMVTVWNHDTRVDAVALASMLRAAGLRVDLYPEPDKIGKQFKYASSRGVPFVTVVGDDERARGEVTVKNMRTGEQNSLKRNEVALVLKTALGG